MDVSVDLFSQIISTVGNYSRDSLDFQPHTIILIVQFYLEVCLKFMGGHWDLFKNRVSDITCLKYYSVCVHTCTCVCVSVCDFCFKVCYCCCNSSDFLYQKSQKRESAFLNHLLLWNDSYSPFCEFSFCFLLCIFFFQRYLLYNLTGD